MENQVQMIGRLGCDPQLSTTRTAVERCYFPLALHRLIRNGENQRKVETEWHRIIAWSSVAEAAHQNLKAGDQVIVLGKLKTSKFKADDGSYRSISQVVMTSFQKLVPAPIQPVPGELLEEEADLPF